MRVGTFLAGSLVGVLAAMYVNRNNRTMMTTSLDQAGEIIGKMITVTRNNFEEAARKVMEATAQTTSSQGQTKQAHIDNLAPVENIVQQDPALKQQVDRILEEDTYSRARH